MSSVRARRGPHLAASGVPQKSLEFEGTVGSRLFIYLCIIINIKSYTK